MQGRCVKDQRKIQDAEGTVCLHLITDLLSDINVLLLW